jgi:hypothetical protein
MFRFVWWLRRVHPLNELMKNYYSGVLCVVAHLQFSRASAFVCAILLGLHCYAPQAQAADPLDDWRLRTSGTANALYMVNFGNNQFIAVGKQGTVVTSPDGKTWTSQSAGTASDIYAVAYGAGQWVATGPGGLILTSPDGITWAQQNSGTTANLFNVAFANDIFIAVGGFAGSSVALSSTDGINWTSSSVDGRLSRTYLSGINFGNSLWVAVGAELSCTEFPVFCTTYPGIYTSATGAPPWTDRIPPGAFDLIDVHYGADMFVAVGSSGGILTSPTGEGWSQRTSPVSTILNSVSFGNGQFVSVGQSGVILSSSDGNSWTRHTSPVSSYLYEVTFGMGTFVAVGENGTILQSPYGVTIKSTSVVEGNAGPTNATFAVSLYPPTNVTVTVDFATADGTALAGSDYTANNGVVIFAPGETSKEIVVEVLGDMDEEAHENFIVTLSNPVNTSLAVDTAFGAIINDDGPSAETVIVESRTTGTATGGITPYPPYQEVAGSWSGSGSHTIAPGVTPNIGSRYAFAGTPVLKITPTLQPGSTYRMSISHITINASPDIVVNISYEGCTGTATSTTNFNGLRGNVWEVVGNITVDEGVTQPSIIFTYASGLLSSSPNRWYSDAFRFENNPCIFTTVPDIVSATGPLAEGQIFVNVPGVSATASAVRVYANGALVGQKIAGITAGQNRVETSPLVKGQIITATQSDANGVETCRASTGPIVGGGTNPRIRMALSVRQNTNIINGTIGADGTSTNAIIKYIGATNIISGGAPMATRFFVPSREWQTVQFQRGDDPANPIDPTYLWNSTDTPDPHQLKGDFGILDGIAFAVEEDTGPFAIYIDNFMNGTTRIQSFEGVGPGTSGVQFNLPGFSGTTSPFLLSQAAGAIVPNSAMVTNNTADHGAHSLYVSWQFKDTNRANWLRLAAASPATGTPNPIVDLRLPISFRMMILPVGQEPPPSPPVITARPANQAVIEGGRATFRVNVRGTAPLSYQWRLNGSDINSATNPTLTLNNVQVAQAGGYSVRVSNSLGNDTSAEGILTVEDLAYTDVMTPAWRLNTGDRTYLVNDSGTRSITFSPITENLLVASRTGGANIHALNAETGDFRYTLLPPEGGYSGGTLVLNQVVSTSDSTIYAGNLTDNGTATTFRLYRWFIDYEDETGQLVWEGNPSNDPNLALRWGDAMTVRETTSGHEIILSSRTSTLLSRINPGNGLNSPASVCNVSTAAGNSFRLGLAADGPEVVWGKMIGLPLLEVQTDFGLGTSTILNSFSGLGTMGPIGVNTVGRLLAGVFIDSPDHLRLFDISTPGQIIPLDTEFFPSDNANGNATGGIAFGNNKVYALCSNNGLLAMNIDTSCLPDRPSIARNGSDVVISWSRSTFRLQGTDSLGGTWDPVPGASPVTVGAGTGMKFFRLVCP